MTWREVVFFAEYSSFPHHQLQLAVGTNKPQYSKESDGKLQVQCMYVSLSNISYEMKSYKSEHRNKENRY